MNNHKQEPSESSPGLSINNKTSTEGSTEPGNDSFLSKRKPKKLVDTLNYTKHTYQAQNPADRKKLAKWVEEHYEKHVNIPLLNGNPPFFFECCNVLVSKTCEMDKGHSPASKLYWKELAVKHSIKSAKDFIDYFCSLPPERQTFPSFNTYHRSMAELEDDVNKAERRASQLESEVRMLRFKLTDELELKEWNSRLSKKAEDELLKRHYELQAEKQALEVSYLALEEKYKQLAVRVIDLEVSKGVSSKNGSNPALN